MGLHEHFQKAEGNNVKHATPDLWLHLVLYLRYEVYMVTSVGAYLVSRFCCVCRATNNAQVSLVNIACYWLISRMKESTKSLRFTIQPTVWLLSCN